jgi:hypothetical protein
LLGVSSPPNYFQDDVLPPSQQDAQGMLIKQTQSNTNTTTTTNNLKETNHDDSHTKAKLCNEI